jgi:hypothetical protein
MEIRVINPTPTQRKYIQSQVEFCVQKLMPKMKGLEITIRMKDLKKEKVYGYCLADPDGDAEVADRPRTFEIQVDKGLKLRKALETICHEMVHVKQYARGELYESSVKGMHRWHGEWMKNDPDYWDCPWEWEAMGRETGLFVQWAEANDLGKKKWAKDT